MLSDDKEETTPRINQSDATYCCWHCNRAGIHDNICDFEIGRPPYLPDMKEGAYLFGGLMRFPRIKIVAACQTLGWINDQIWSVWPV